MGPIRGHDARYYDAEEHTPRLTSCAGGRPERTTTSNCAKKASGSAAASSVKHSTWLVSLGVFGRRVCGWWMVDGRLLLP